MAEITYKDRGLKKIMEKIRALADGPYVKVGVIGDGENAMIATVHEYGAPEAGIPERSFLRRTFADADVIKKKVAMSAKFASQILAGKMEVGQALGLLGAMGAAEVKRTITSQKVTPQLSATEAGRRTIARKGSSVALVDTGQLLNSITWQVVGASGGEDGPTSGGRG